MYIKGVRSLFLQRPEILVEPSLPSKSGLKMTNLQRGPLTLPFYQPFCYLKEELGEAASWIQLMLVVYSLWKRARAGERLSSARCCPASEALSVRGGDLVETGLK